MDGIRLHFAPDAKTARELAAKIVDPPADAGPTPDVQDQSTVSAKPADDPKPAAVMPVTAAQLADPAFQTGLQVLARTATVHLIMVATHIASTLPLHERLDRLERQVQNVDGHVNYVDGKTRDIESTAYRARDEAERASSDARHAIDVAQRSDRNW